MQEIWRIRLAEEFILLKKLLLNVFISKCCYVCDIILSVLLFLTKTFFLKVTLRNKAEIKLVLLEKKLWKLEMLLWQLTEIKPVWSAKMTN